MDHRSALIQSPKVLAFINLIDSKGITPVETQLSGVDELYYGCIESLVKDNSHPFIQLYTAFSLREPDERAPYVRDEYLLFVILCCLKKFSIDDSWFKKVLNSRICSTDECAQLMNTFKSLIRDDYESSSNLIAISIVTQSILKLPMIKNELWRKMYREYMSNDFPFYKIDFLNIVALKSLDIIILEADISGNGKVTKLRTFENEFIKRTNLIANISYYSIMLGILLTSYLMYGKYKDYIDILSTIGGVLGMTGLVVPSIFSKETNVNLLQKFIRKLLGYSNHH